MWSQKTFQNLTSICHCMVIFLLLGCAHTTYTSLVPQTYSATQNKPEVLFQTPNRPFEIIGLLESNGGAGITHPELIESMKTKAQTVGAQAIYILGLQEHTAQPGLMYNPWLGGYQSVGGGRRARVYGLAMRYVVGDIALAKELYGKWEGVGVSTIVGEFSLLTTLMGSEGGVTGVVTASSGFSGTINGHVSGSTVELLAIPSDLNNYCILKFVGEYDGDNRLQGQYSSVLCGASEGGVLELVRRGSRPKVEDTPDLSPDKSTKSTL